MSTTPAIEWWRPVAPPGRTQTLFEVSASSRFSFVALLVFTVLLLIAPQSFLPALAPLRLALLAAGVAIAAHLIDRFSRGAAAAKLAPEIWIAIMLAGWALLIVPLSLWPGGSLGFLGGLFAKSLVLFWLLSQVVVTSGRLQWTAWCLVLISLPLAVTGIWNFLAGVFLPEGRALGLTRIAGYEAPLTTNPNDLALMLNLILPLGLALILSVRRPILKAVLVAIVALDVLAVVATFSRGGFLTLAVIGLAYIIRLSGRYPAVLLLPLLLLLCVPLLPAGYLGQMGTIADIGLDPTGSAQERWTDIKAAGRLIQSNPLFGVGAGMNALAMNAERGETWRMIHNVYLQYTVELGLPGLILFLFLLVRCIRKAGAARAMAARTDNGGLLFRLAEAVQISLVAFAVAALFHPAAYHFYFYYLGGLALGLWAAVNALQAPQAPQAQGALRA